MEVLISYGGSIDELPPLIVANPDGTFAGRSAGTEPQTPQSFREGHTTALETGREQHFLTDVAAPQSGSVIERPADGPYALTAPAEQLEAVIFPMGEHGTLSILADDRPIGAVHVRLTQLVATLAEETLDRLDRETRLRRRERALERQNEQLSEFAAIVSHDLRNPLNVARGSANHLLKQDVDGEHPERIADQLERMETLIEEVLTLVQGGRQDADREPTVLADIVSDAWESVPTQGCSLVIDDLGTVHANEHQLRQLFENLFRNAVTHGHPRAPPHADDTDPDSANLTVRVGRSDDGFFLADDGVGFQTEDPSQLFERGHSESADGTGLGLAIVRSVVRAHGWSVRTSTSESGGARFDVEGVEWR
jgi:signal transduction histidine kinase